ncbi:MAG: WecB/TagA/CpsF family glycosyltransferase [Cyanobacteriota bacterium]|nr:WecB/TagA/CpsF family glycosyltransferase [Cyanobacteriota bacterium]
MSDVMVLGESTVSRFPVLGLPVHLHHSYHNWLLNRLYNGLGTHVITLNAEMTMQAEQDHRLGEVIRGAELVIPDGAGIVLYLRLKGKQIKRCPGIELAESFLQKIGQYKRSDLIFFYGGKPGVAQRAADRFQQTTPNLAIASYHGYLSTSEEEQLKDSLRDLQPKIIFVGLGVPRQELWIARHRYLCPNSIWVGVGGSFDIWAGTKKRAPAWFCDNNLEWLYRLYQEPWRWRRMLALPQFALKALLS